ncbi:MAG: hydrolase [Bacteroidales bacterium]
MRLHKDNAVGLVIDMQERLFPHMAESDRLLERTRLLLMGLRLLEVPVMLTEQYPKGLGPTLEQVMEMQGVTRVSEKLTFSCCGEPGFVKALENSARSQVLICGIETHVCILQTTLDLMERGFQAVVIADCVSSRSLADKDIALARMRSEGAVITTAESLLFELTERAGTEQFKAISRLVK